MPVRAFAGKSANAAVISLLEQTVADFELLLIGYDDLRDWQKQLPQDSRIRLLIRDRPGIVPALNLGLTHARGRYVARMDADDLSLPQRFRQQLDFLRRFPALALISSQVIIRPTPGLTGTGSYRYQQWLNSVLSSAEISDNLFVESPLPHPTWFTTRKCLQSLGGWRDTDWPEDYDLLLRAHCQGLKFGKVDQPLLYWTDHAKRLTRTDNRYSRQNFLRAKAWAIARLLSPDRAIICGTGRNARWLHDALQIQGIPVCCFVEQDDGPTRTSRRNKPVLTYREMLQRRTNELIITAVTAWGARDQLRELFVSHGLIETRDFLIAG